MQHHPFTWLARPLATMRPASRRPLHQPRRMQLRLGPGVAPPKPGLLANPLVEMLHIPSHVMRPVLTEHPSDLVHWHPPGRLLAKPAIHQSAKSILIVAPSVTPELSLRHPEYLSSLERRELLALPSAQYVAKLLHPAVL